jgi:hypothetical protein
MKRGSKQTEEYLRRLAEERLCELIGRGSFNDPQYQDMRDKVNDEPINPMDREGRFRRMGEEIVATRISPALKNELIDKIIFNGSLWTKKIRIASPFRAVVEIHVEEHFFSS